MLKRLTDIVPVNPKNGPSGGAKGIKKWMTSDLQTAVGNDLMYCTAAVAFGVDVKVVGDIINTKIKRTNPLKLELAVSEDFDLSTFTHELNQLFFTEYVATTGTRPLPGDIGGSKGMTDKEFEVLKDRIVQVSAKNTEIKQLFDDAGIASDVRSAIVQKALQQIHVQFAKDAFNINRLRNKIVLDNVDFRNEITTNYAGMTLQIAESVYTNCVNLHDEILKGNSLVRVVGFLKSCCNNAFVKTVSLLIHGTQKSGGYQINVFQILEELGIETPTKKFDVVDYRIRAIKSNSDMQFDVRHMLYLASRIENIVMGVQPGTSVTSGSGTSVAALTMEAIKRVLSENINPSAFNNTPSFDKEEVEQAEKLFRSLMFFFMLRRCDGKMTGRVYSAITQAQKWSLITKDQTLASLALDMLKEVDTFSLCLYDVYQYCNSYTDKYNDYLLKSGHDSMSIHSEAKSGNRPTPVLINVTEYHNLLFIRDYKRTLLLGQDQPSVNSLSHLRSYMALYQHKHPETSSKVHINNIFTGPENLKPVEIYYFNSTSGTLEGVVPMFNPIVTMVNSLSKNSMFVDKIEELFRSMSLGQVRLDYVFEDRQNFDIVGNNALYLLPFSFLQRETIQKRFINALNGDVKFWSKGDIIILSEIISCGAIKGMFGPLKYYSTIEDVKLAYGITEDLFEGIQTLQNATIKDILSLPTIDPELKEYLRNFEKLDMVLVYENTTQKVFYLDKKTVEVIYRSPLDSPFGEQVFSYCNYPAYSTTSAVLDKAKKQMIQIIREYGSFVKINKDAMTNSDDEQVEPMSKTKGNKGGNKNFKGKSTIVEDDLGLED